MRIPVTGDLHLSARSWRPKDGCPVPAISKYIPSRERFGTRVRDAHTHPWLGDPHPQPLTADKENFPVYADLDAYDGENRIRSDSRMETIPRDHV